MSAIDREPEIAVPTPVRQAAYDAVYRFIDSIRTQMPPDLVHRNALIWRAVEAGLDALDEQGRLLPAPAEVRVEFGAWCHGEDRGGIRLSTNMFASREQAVEWAESKVGQYGICQYTIMRREHHVFADGSRFATAITAWVEDKES